MWEGVDGVGESWRKCSADTVKEQLSRLRAANDMRKVWRMFGWKVWGLCGCIRFSSLQHTLRSGAFSMLQELLLQLSKEGRHSTIIL